MTYNKSLQNNIIYFNIIAGGDKGYFIYDGEFEHEMNFIIVHN